MKQVTMAHKPAKRDTFDVLVEIAMRAVIAFIAVMLPVFVGLVVWPESFELPPIDGLFVLRSIVAFVIVFKLLVSSGGLMRIALTPWNDSSAHINPALQRLW